MKRIVLLAFAMLATVSLKAQTDTLRLSTLYTTHLIFQSELAYVDISNKAIAAKIVDSSKNILAIKAKYPFDYTTTISALESDGNMHTYIVCFDDSPSDLVIDLRNGSTKKATSVQRGPSVQAPEVAQQRQKLFHIADSKYHLTVCCEEILVSNDVTHFVLSLRNRSGISYECGEAAFMVESRKRSRRSLDYQKTLPSKSRYGTLSTAPSKTSKVVYTMDKITLSNDQVLRIYLYETGGSRNFVLTLTAKDINNAGRLL